MIIKTLIIEDELFTAERLKSLLQKIDLEIEVLDIIPSVTKTLEWFDQNEAPDLIFMDIHLEDQNSFEIFEELEILTPIIYTTAYDQYALQAFKQNSIDYLMKPIDKEELYAAIEKFKSIHVNNIKEYREGDRKERFLVRRGEEWISIPVNEIACFISENKLSFLQCLDGRRFVVDYSLDQILGLVNDKHFYRINRSRIMALEGIHKIHSYFNGRLKLEVKPEEKEEVFVSRDRVSGFKKWLNS